MTLSGGSSFFPVGMEQQNSSQKMWMLMTWICTQMPLEDMAVGHTSRSLVLLQVETTPMSLKININPVARAICHHSRSDDLGAPLESEKNLFLL